MNPLGNLAARSAFGGRRSFAYRCFPAMLLVAGSLMHAQERASPGPTSQRIFREVEFPPYDQVRLGEVLGPSAPPGRHRSADRFVLIGVGGTDSITIRLDRAGR